MRVVFLDYDGVVNTPMWDNEGLRCRFNFPQDNKVNNFQSCQWVSEFCKRYNYSIVVTSTWRFDDNYADCLRNGGLRDDIKILGAVPNLWHLERGGEIKAYLEDHPEIDEFLIFDDENRVGDLKDHLVLCDESVGFLRGEFRKAEKLHNKLYHGTTDTELLW